MKRDKAMMSRRSFLIGSVAVAGGVAFGTWRIAQPTSNPLLDDLQYGEAALTPFVKITPDGITLIVPRADLGQGMASLQAYLIAEELDIDPATARLEPGKPHKAYVNRTLTGDSLPVPLWDQGWLPEMLRSFVGSMATLADAQFTGGSSSTADLHERLRMAGAVARETLKQTAARRTGIAVSKLSTDNGDVILPDRTRLPYTELAAEAAMVSVVTDVTLRDPSEWRYLGQSLLRTDIVAKSMGEQQYGIDMQLPGLLHATVHANPGRGGGLGEYDASRTLAMRGVKAVVPISDGLGVIADNTWRAFKAAAVLEVNWPSPDYPGSSSALWKLLESAAVEDNRDSRLRNDGDVEAIHELADDVITSEYRTPFLTHAALEPLSATVLVEKHQVTIWTATQIPMVVRDMAAELTGLPAEKVTVNALMAGGSFGRRLDHDYIIQAVEIAMTMPGTPIKTTWSRESDMAQDFPRPFHMARARGTVSMGKVVSYDLDSISPSLISSWFKRILFVPPGPDALLVWGAYDQPYSIPHYRVSGYRAPDVLPIGSWRAPGANSNSFFHEGFLSELIHAADADPLEERLRLISDTDSQRVLEAVGEMSNWNGSDIGEDRGRGIAFAHTHGVPVAQVVDVTLTENGIRIDDVWIAADCGTVFDPVNAEAQLTGAAVWGLGHAMNCEITYNNYRIQQTNYHTYQGMRLYQTPRFHTRLLGKAEKVRGLGEPATAPAAPALADAIFAATGQRLREMPFNRFVEFV